MQPPEFPSLHCSRIQLPGAGCLPLTLDVLPRSHLSRGPCAPSRASSSHFPRGLGFPAPLPFPFCLVSEQQTSHGSLFGGGGEGGLGFGSLFQEPQHPVGADCCLCRRGACTSEGEQDATRAAGDCLHPASPQPDRPMQEGQFPKLPPRYGDGKRCSGTARPCQRPVWAPRQPSRHGRCFAGVTCTRRSPGLSLAAPRGGGTNRFGSPSPGSPHLTPGSSCRAAHSPTAATWLSTSPRDEPWTPRQGRCPFTASTMQLPSNASPFQQSPAPLPAASRTLHPRPEHLLSASCHLRTGHTGVPASRRGDKRAGETQGLQP